MNLIAIIIFLGIAQGILVGFFLITLNRGNIKANRLLGVLMILLSVSISGFLMDVDNFSRQYKNLPPSVIFLFGPLFYFYVLTLIKRNFRLKKKHLTHFFPFIILLLYIIPFDAIRSKEELASGMSTEFLTVGGIVLGLQTVHVFIYMYCIKKILKEHEIKIKSTLACLENIHLKWLNLSVYIFAFIFSVVALSLILSLAGINTYSYFHTIIPVLVSLAILGLGYWGFRQPIIFPTETSNQKNKKYEWSTLTDAKSEEYLSKLSLVMNREKPYLDSDLTLQKLAGSIEVTPQHLSQVINEKLNQNFFDFVNCYRIKEAKRLLVDPRGELLTILAIAEEVGFNSKSSFNSAFKKLTGMTPSEYKKSYSPENLLS